MERCAHCGNDDPKELRCELCRLDRKFDRMISWLLGGAFAAYVGVLLYVVFR